MSEFPDPDEEFDLLYGDELELIREQEENFDPLPKSKKSLNFNDEGSSGTSSVNKDKHFVTNSETCFNDITNSQLNDTTVVISTNNEVSNNDLPNRKRTVEDLFGDISDFENDFLENSQPDPKKHKNDKYSEDLALIEHILELRKLSKQKHTVTTFRNSNDFQHYEARDKKNLSYSVPKYPFIGVTRFDGEKIYVRFHSEEYEKDETQRIIKEVTFKGVMGDIFKGVWEEAEKLVNIQMNMETENTDIESVDTVDQTDENIKQLWVDLYKPRKYLELLSDESTNRIMLRWIKLWDKCVFNRKPRVKPVKPVENGRNKFFEARELDTTLDEHGRPRYKVALLCGPPGLGKTTLAHMVARHAGYNVVEINASDDRSTDAFKTALENATQMRSVVDQEGRPNCLVFDEIDGAPQASIDFLIKFVNGAITTKSKKGKSQKQSILKRPIICICNDIFVPSLRALRQIAFVVKFPPISSARLAERLMEIARRQQIKTDLGALMALAEKSNKDVRSCLSVLHFFKAQGKPVTLSEIYKSSIGQKDMKKGFFSVWQDIFQIQRNKQEKDLKTELSMKTRMSKILQVVSSFGDYEMLSQGVFENFPLLKLKDSSMEAIQRSLQWFVFSDLINKQISSLQNYQLMPYLQYGFVIWHFSFATSLQQKLIFPSAGYEARQKENLQRAIVAEVLRGLQPRVRPFCQRLSLILDILPLIIIIIVPNFRPVSLHLYTKEEKENMLSVVNIMIDYNLNYVQERSPDGSFAFNLEPHIENIVIFDKSSTTKRKTLSYSNKQLISREVELEKLRKFEISTTTTTDLEKSKTSATPKFSKFKRDLSKTSSSDNGGDQANLPNHLQTLKAKTVKIHTPAPRKDFFGRIIKNISPKGKQGMETTNDIWYQYKEGYSNAVRKRITISQLK